MPLSIGMHRSSLRLARIHRIERVASRVWVAIDCVEVGPGCAATEVGGYQLGVALVAKGAPDPHRLGRETAIGERYDIERSCAEHPMDLGEDLDRPCQVLDG